MKYRYSIITLWDQINRSPRGTIIGVLVQDDKRCYARIRRDKDFLDEQSTTDQRNLSVTWGQRLYNLEEKTNDLLDSNVVMYIQKKDKLGDIYEVADHIRPNDPSVLDAIRQKASTHSVDPMSPEAVFPFPTYSDWSELESDKDFDTVAEEILKKVMKQVRERENRNDQSIEQ